MKKNIIRAVAIIFGSALFINGLAMMILVAGNIGSYLTAALGLAIILPAVFKNTAKTVFSWNISKFLLVFISFFSVSFIVISSVLFIYGNVNTVTYKEDYLLVLGCGVNGETPSNPLVSRLDKALEYCERNPDCKIIVSGGQGNGEDITEAEAMRRYLVDEGIENDRIIKEEQSTSTTENFIFSNRIIDGGFGSYSVAFITNDFHVYRANSLARYQGFQMTHMGAPTSWYNIFPSYLREMLAIVQMVVFNK